MNTGQRFIISLQECGEDPVAIQRLIRPNGARAAHVVGNGGRSILCSDPLLPCSIPTDTVGQRFVMSRTDFDGREVAIVNYHGEAKGMSGSPDPTERGGIASEVRWRIDEFSGQSTVIVMGDFNAEPHETEVTSLYCFSFAPAPGLNATCSHNRPRQDIRLAPQTDILGGTHYLSSTTCGSRWQRLDFLAAPPLLNLRASSLLILEGENLTDNGKPTKSDHLPVAADMVLP